MYSRVVRWPVHRNHDPITGSGHLHFLSSRFSYRPPRKDYYRIHSLSQITSFRQCYPHAKVGGSRSQCALPERRNLGSASLYHSVRNPLKRLGETVVLDRLSLSLLGASLHFSRPNGRSTRYDRQDFVALACRAQRTVQVRLRAPSGARLVLTALSLTSPRHVVRNAGQPSQNGCGVSLTSLPRPKGGRRHPSRQPRSLLPHRPLR